MQVDERREVKKFVIFFVLLRMTLTLATHLVRFDDQRQQLDDRPRQLDVLSLVSQDANQRHDSSANRLFFFLIFR